MFGEGNLDSRKLSQKKYHNPCTEGVSESVSI